MTDSMHALYGRRFTVFSITRPPGGPSYADVLYKDPMRLRIYLDSTQLGVPRFYLGTKLTLESVTELVTVFRQCDALCPRLPSKSGDVCPQISKLPSSKS
ncbi:MAG: hypothetical protein WA783_01235 [Phormidesmis sp.]